MWRDSNESRGFVPLLAHKHYIEKKFALSHIVLEENYIAIIIVIELSPSPNYTYELHTIRRGMSVTKDKQPQFRYHVAFKVYICSVIKVYTKVYIHTLYLL